jgi:hypothetical protein
MWIAVQVSLGINERPHMQKFLKQKGLVFVAEVVKSLSSKQTALSSNTSATQNKTNKQKDPMKNRKIQ